MFSYILLSVLNFIDFILSFLLYIGL